MAQRFCVEWKPIRREQDERFTGLEEELKLAGAAAGPALLEILGTNQYDAFGRLHAEDGVTAWMQVNALFGVSFLDLREAVPHVLLHCRGPSATCTSSSEWSSRRSTRARSPLASGQPTGAVQSIAASAEDVGPRRAHVNASRRLTMSARHERLTSVAPHVMTARWGQLWTAETTTRR